MMKTVIKKELRGYFNSAIAVIFLAAFLGVTLYTFFGKEKFFARGLADLRPLFESMPKLLIILVSALAMRLWSDERRAGTLEVLLTLPVPRWQLVVGKFLAGMVLIAVALALTIGLPITVAKMGNLDFGPVVGGYLAALLLSAAYLAIGMCVSAATDNQIVAFVVTALLCALAYLIGDLGGEVGRFLGTGARFESVARGVLDLRDLAYYGGIVCVGIALNVLLLQRLGWSRGARGQRRRMAALLGVGLVLANAVALDVWLAPVKHARIDLTQDGAYSLSPSTQKILAGLDEKLVIHGYFSERTHPKLAPLVPRLRDLLEEYRIAGGNKVRVEVIDPTDSDEAKKDAKEKFGIDPTPLRFATQTEKSVVNAYFAVAIEYGDQHSVIGLDELISVRVLDIGDLEISLKNPEYQLTKTIKKTVSEFSSVDALFASTPGKIQLTAYVTPKQLPDNWKDGPAKLQKVVDELVKQAGGKLAFSTVEPKSETEMRELFDNYGLRPYSDLLSGQVYYFHLLLQVGDRMVRITPPQSLGEAELKAAVTEGLKRAAPGFTRVVGLWQPPASPPMQQMQGMPPQPSQELPPPQTFRTLERALAGNYEVRPVPLTAPVPDDVEALVLAGPASLDAKAAEYVDQFVMRGGAVVALAGRFRIAAGQGLAVEKVTTGLEAAFTKWGINVGDDLVMDPKSDSFPVPQNRDLGNGMMVREIQQLAYPFFVKMDGDQLASSSVITSGLAGSVMHWAAPVKADAKVGEDAHKVEPLLTSSDAAWRTSSTSVEPDLRRFPGTGFADAKDVAADKKGAQVMAVSVSGGFASSVAKPAKAQSTPGAAPEAGAGGDRRLIEHSPPDTRIVVFGSSAFVSDDVLGLAQQLDSDFAASNVELVHNAVDWSLADTDLLAIRSRNAATRALTVAPESRGMWRTVNIVIALLALGLVVGFAWLRRRAVQPVTAGRAEMLTKFHKILLAALAVQLVLVVVVLSRGGDSVAIKEHPIVAGFDAAKVTRVQVFAAADGKAIDLVKRDAGWVLASGYDYPVDAAKVTDVLGPIAKASAAEPIATQAGRHKQLRVADGEFDRKLVITSGGKDLTLFLGGPAGTRRNALRIGGDNDVYGVAGISAGAVGSEPRAWLDPAYVKVPRDEVAKLTVVRDGASVELTKLAAPPVPAAGSDGVLPPPAADKWTATVGGAAIALGKDEVIDDGAIERIVSSATMIDLTAPADPKRDATKPTATITIDRKAAAPAAGSGSAAPAAPAGPTVIDVIADGASYWVHDRGSPRAVLVDKARLDDVVTAGRDKLVKKPAPPAKQSATPGLPPGLQLPPGTQLPPGVTLPGGPDGPG